MVALRTDLRECVNLGIDNIIIEGDSWCASRWALGYSKPPWRLANVADEVIQLITGLNACFVGVLMTQLMRSQRKAWGVHFFLL